jgi:hypothetical protein
MHPVGQGWADEHGDLIEGGLSRTACRACHGALDRGSELSRSKANRTIPTHENKFGTKHYWAGRTVSCYDCHNGANSTDPTTHPPAVAENVVTNTTSGAPVMMTLKAGGSASYRIVSQPAHGAVAVSNSVATYFPDPGFVGLDQFTFTAWNNWVDSNLATGRVAVTEGPFSISVKAFVPERHPAGWLVPFTAWATPSNTTAEVTFDWVFGDGAIANNTPNAAHIYALPGSYAWRVTARANSASAVATGIVAIDHPVTLTMARSFDRLLMSWPEVNGVLEQTASLQPPIAWLANTNVPFPDGGYSVIELVNPQGTRVYRLRQVR